MVNKIIKHFNKEAGNKMERNKSKNKVESLFDKIEELRNIESRLINERLIRIERINFEIEETKKEIALQSLFTWIFYLFKSVEGT